MTDLKDEKGGRRPSEVSADLRDGLARCREVVDTLRQRLTGSEASGQDNDRLFFEDRPDNQLQG